MKLKLSFLCCILLGCFNMQAQNLMIINQGNGTQLQIPLQSIDSVRFSLVPPPAIQKIFQNNGNVLSVAITDIDSITYLLPNPQNLAQIVTQPVTPLSSTSAYGGGNITSEGTSLVTQRGVCWSLTPNPTLANNFTIDGSGLGAFGSDLLPLQPGTLYYVRAYAVNTTGTAYGNTQLFNTPNASGSGSLPTISTNIVGYTDGLSASCGGNITSDGGQAVTTRGVCWAIGITPTINNNITTDGAGGGSFTSTLNNLLPGTSYFVRAYATNSMGTAYGITYSFTTKSLPIITTNAVDAFSSSAQSGGNISTNGGSNISWYGVCFGTSPAPVAIFGNPNCVTGGFNNFIGNFNSTITGLNPSTTYYIRAFATNGMGTSYGNTLTFTTQGGITSLDCSSSNNNGTLIAGTAAIGVNSVLQYTGGNGGTHNGQTVTSTGVGGLTASLAASNFAIGAGNLTYTITGTPSASGTASFVLSIGGQSCSLTRTVVLPIGSINALNCASAVNNGILTFGDTANGVSSIIPYTGGNGGTHNGQIVTSTGVNGLTATLVADTFANGADSLTYTITGAPSVSGTASFAINIGGQNCNLNWIVNLPIGSITTLKCDSAVTNGTLTIGAAVSSVSCKIPYTGGNGGSHNGQIVNSFGVNGLMASLTSGVFSNGSDSLTYNISGTPNGSGIVTFELNIGGQICLLNLIVNSGIPGAGVTFDGYTYSSVVLGNGQEWMAENLRTTHYANGDIIANDTSNSVWIALNTGSWSHYNNDSQFENPYGKLYNWYAVADPRNVCPSGWHVPSDAEWNTLIGYLDPLFDPTAESFNQTIHSYTAGDKMRSNSTQYWQYGNQNATNESGFSALPSGYRHWLYGTYGEMGISTCWYSSTESVIPNGGWRRCVSGAGVGRGVSAKNYGEAVRCLKD